MRCCKRRLPFGNSPLEKLTLSEVRGVSDVSGLVNHPTLKQLHISGHIVMTPLRILPDLPKLEELSIFYRGAEPRFFRFPDADGFPSLKRLELKGNILLVDRGVIQAYVRGEPLEPEIERLRTAARRFENAENVENWLRLLAEPDNFDFHIRETGTFQGHAYARIQDNNAQSWHLARDLAEFLGGHLVTIGSEEEQKWLAQGLLTDAGTSQPIWMGLYRDGQDQPFQWVTGEPPEFQTWYGGKPTQSQLDFAAGSLRVTSDHQWTDSGPVRSRHFIVEWED